MSISWYFVRLAFLAVPWKSKSDKNAKGTLFKQYYLVQARNIESAFKKAQHILTTSEHCDGDGRLNGKKVAFQKVGILDLEPLYELLQSGIEIFDESELNVTYADIKKRVIPVHKQIRLIVHEKKQGKPTLLNVNWGERFNRL
jgi:hypothetical protein